MIIVESVMSGLFNFLYSWKLAEFIYLLDSFQLIYRRRNEKNCVN